MLCHEPRHKQLFSVFKATWPHYALQRQPTTLLLHPSQTLLSVLPGWIRCQAKVFLQAAMLYGSILLAANPKECLPRLSLKISLVPTEKASGVQVGSTVLWKWNLQYAW
jgi:hypothetical protein